MNGWNSVRRIESPRETSGRERERERKRKHKRAYISGLDFAQLNISQGRNESAQIDGKGKARQGKTTKTKVKQTSRRGRRGGDWRACNSCGKTAHRWVQTLLGRALRTFFLLVIAELSLSLSLMV